MIYTDTEREENIKWLARNLRNLTPEKSSSVLPSVLAETKRVLPVGLTPFPGPFRWDKTPFMREPLDALAETDPTQEVVVMKGAQVVGTVAVIENMLLYIIDEVPGPTMYVSADQGTVETAVELRVDRMLESAGIKNKIFAQSAGKRSRKSVDTKKKKEFPGGFLIPVGPSNPDRLRSFSVRYILFDEIDAYPAAAGKEGDPLTLAKRRTDSFEMFRKILYISTPLELSTSKIYKKYLE